MLLVVTSNNTSYNWIQLVTFKHRTGYDWIPLVLSDTELVKAGCKWYNQTHNWLRLDTDVSQTQNWLLLDSVGSELVMTGTTRHKTGYDW